MSGLDYFRAGQRYAYEPVNVVGDGGTTSGVALKTCCHVS